MDYARLHRDDLMPVVGKKAVLAFLAEKGTKEVSFEPMDGEVAKSADLGYTYGKYESAVKTSSAAAVEKGYFIHVWKRDENGKWKIVADIAKPIPPEK
jgi:ketosteroid isomerase-like protein